jgi:magnesium chelatase family protein
VLNTNLKGTFFSSQAVAKTMVDSGGEKIISYAEPTKDIRRRVSGAREIQSKRFARSKIFCNAKMSSRHIRTHCKTDDSSRRLLESTIDKLGLSARAFNRILKIARTIADLEGKQEVQVDHISEAIQYRNLDRGSQFK